MWRQPPLIGELDDSWTEWMTSNNLKTVTQVNAFIENIIENVLIPLVLKGTRGMRETKRLLDPIPCHLRKLILETSSLSWERNGARQNAMHMSKRSTAHYFLFKNYGARLDLPDANGNNILHLACIYRSCAIVEDIVAYNRLNVFTPNRAGESAFELLFMNACGAFSGAEFRPFYVPIQIETRRLTGGLPPARWRNENERWRFPNGFAPNHVTQMTASVVAFCLNYIHPEWQAFDGRFPEEILEVRARIVHLLTPFIIYSTIRPDDEAITSYGIVKGFRLVKDMMLKLVAKYPDRIGQYMPSLQEFSVRRYTNWFLETQQQQQQQQQQYYYYYY